MVNYSINDFNIEELGSFYDKDKTIFRVFAPESKQVFLCINNQLYEMHKNVYTFEIVISGDLEKNKYYYQNDLGIKYRDPFAYYSDDDYSYVLDVDKFNHDKYVPTTLNDIVIYEANIRDFSCDSNYFGEYKNKFLALIKNNIKSADGYSIGLDYLKELGISHLQLMPVFSYDYDHSDYNWGYNPLAYNYVHKDYVFNQDDPYAYINELRQCVNILHLNNIRVSLDVVFNHVYKVELFDLDKMLLGHTFRKMADGSLAKGSLCGNEIASEDCFVRAYLIEMCKRYLALFDIDGLRIDLMGILDYETVNIIKDTLKQYKNDFIVYGEGWNMGDSLSPDLRACINNANKMMDIKMFNDFFRETIISYVCDNDSIREDVKLALSGNNNHMQYCQSINYIECHDGYTFFDRILKYKNTDELDIKIRRAKLGLSLVLIARGIPFIQMGQEFLRTKNLLKNTYNASEDINKIDWDLRIKNHDICAYFKDLVDIRKENASFNNASTDVSFVDYYECLIYNLDDLMIIINPCIFDHIYQDGHEYEVIFDINGKNCYTSSVLAISAFSILICKR